jgi:hypothetical protein
MEIHIDLFGCKDKEDVFTRFGEILQFGGPKGNVKIGTNDMISGWGMNWAAFYDCLKSLEEGGIYGSAKKIKFPLKLVVHNFEDFKLNSPKDFEILAKTRNHVKKYYLELNQKFDFTFE